MVLEIAKTNKNLQYKCSDVELLQFSTLIEETIISKYAIIAKNKHKTKENGKKTTYYEMWIIMWKTMWATMQSLKSS